MKNPKPLKLRRSKISYAKWGYIFVAPFFLVYIVFSLVPQFLTIYNSFFENYRDGLQQIGPNFVGLENYKTLFTPTSDGEILVLKYALNTLILWILGAVPQFVIALLLAIFFTSYRLNIKGQGFFKTVIYMPNLIMAAAFSMLFFTLFSRVGPIQALLTSWGVIDQSFDFFSFKITFPLLLPIFAYCLITALIGGIQMFDVPQVLTKGNGVPNGTTRTMVMYLNNYLTNKDYGMGGAISVIIFIITAVLSGIVYKMLTKQYKDPARKRRERKGNVL
ncbi:MAG: sugar ABC transporter permease [Lachnospiraceae bacterium]|nr:sugar ABC transporter permease [Lachnospiraceae bacterium]